MRNISFLISLLIVLLMISCKSYRYIDIQVLKPGTVKIPQKVNNLIVIDPRKVLKFGNHYLVNDKHIPYYQLAINSFSSTLRQCLEQSPSFDTTNIIFPITYFKDSIPAISINDTSGKTLLLKFYYRILIDTTYARTNVSIGADGQLNISSVGYCFRLFYKFQFELDELILSNKTNKIIDWYEFSDVLVWLKIIPTEDGSHAVMEVARKAAEKYAQRIAPYWSTEERMMYYAGNQLMRKGYKRFCEDDLDGAVTLWNKLYDTGTRKLASLAAHNIALVYEIQDDLNACENWLVKSIQSKLYSETEKYLEKVRKRKLTRISLDMQLE